MAIVAVLLVCLACVVRAVTGVCPAGCVCIPGVITVCGTTDTELYWQNLISFGSSAIVDVTPGSFTEGGHITLLDLSNNPTLTLYNGSFIGLSNLTSLDLSHSGLTALPDHLFTPLTSLEHLDLSYNDLTSVNPVAFEGVHTLQTLTLTFNQLAVFPSPTLLPQLEQLTAIYLYPNQIDCSNDNIVSLLQLLHSGAITDGNILRCSNGTLVRLLEYEQPSPSPSITVAMSSTPTQETSRIMVSMTTTTSYLVTPSAPRPSAMTSTLSIVPSSTPFRQHTHIPTPTPLAIYCEEEFTLTTVGRLDWPRTMAVAIATSLCPASVNAAYRECLSDGVWGVVNDSLCEVEVTASQLLDSINKVPITAQSSERLSHQLATSLTSDLRLSSQELDALASIATALVGVASENVAVLDNTLSALSTVLFSNSGQLSIHTARRLRLLIDSVLLKALSQNNTHLVLSYSNLAVGGAYLPSSNQSRLLAYVRLQTNSTVGIEIGGEGEESSDVTVAIDGGEGSVQVTVYDGDDLFNQSNCSNATGEVGGNVLTPIITVTNEDSNNSEVVTISYSHVTTSQGHTIRCVRWIPFDCGGGVWSQSDCSLATSNAGQLQCQCLHQGSYAVLDVPDDSVMTNIDDQLTLISTILFHVLVSVTLPLYIIIIIAILSSTALRPLPSYQCVMFLSFSQCLSLLVKELSLTQPTWLCYSLATLTHYTVLVTLSWMIVYPVLEAIKVFKVIWYEKSWFITPFAVIAWVWPAIPVGIYAGLRHADFPQSPELCWFESVTFPNTFTYIFGLTGLIVIVTTFATLILLACSDYTLEPSIYLRLVSSLVTFALYSGVVVCVFFTGSSHQFNINRDHMMIVTGGVTCLCGLYFFISYGLFESRLRSVLTCRADPELKTKIPHYSKKGADSGFHSHSSPTLPRTRRPPVRLTDELNINYVDDYLGFPHRGGPVPMAMLGAVREGTRVNPMRSDLPVFTNPLYNITLSDQL